MKIIWIDTFKTWNLQLFSEKALNVFEINWNRIIFVNLSTSAIQCTSTYCIVLRTAGNKCYTSPYMQTDLKSEVNSKLWGLLDRLFSKIKASFIFQKQLALYFVVKGQSYKKYFSCAFLMTPINIKYHENVQNLDCSQLINNGRNGLPLLFLYWKPFKKCICPPAQLVYLRGSHDFMLIFSCVSSKVYLCFGNKNTCVTIINVAYTM